MTQTECFMDNSPHWVAYGLAIEGEYSLCVACGVKDEGIIKCCGCGKALDFGIQIGPTYRYERVILQWAVCSEECSNKVENRIWKELPWYAKDAYLDSLINDWKRFDNDRRAHNGIS